MGYTEKQLEWVQENNVATGDCLVIVKIPTEEEIVENGWCDIWIEEMGQVGDKIFLDAIKSKGLICYHPRTFISWVYPYFCLSPFLMENE